MVNRIKQAIEAWAKDRKAFRHGHVHADESTLWSYNEPIAFLRWSPEGQKWIAYIATTYTAERWSKTTQRHTSMVEVALKREGITTILYGVQRGRVRLEREAR